MEKHLAVRKLLAEAIKTMPAANSFDEEVALDLRTVARKLDQRIQDLKAAKPAAPAKKK